MGFRLIKDYRDDEPYRKSFNELAKLVFGIDFERWNSLGFWNERYICYSILDGDRVVSNVSANIMDLIINGGRVPAIQIGTVMTHPAYRGKGLAARLMDTVLNEYKNKCDIVFLFANPEASGFYRKFGFNTVNETCFYLEKKDVLVKGGNCPNDTDGCPNDTDGWPNETVGALKLQKLDMSAPEDVNILRRLLSARMQLSSRFGTDRTEGILAWHCLNVFPEDIYFLEALDTIVICRRENGALHLYDVIGPEMPDYRKVMGALETGGGTEEVIFHFTPDCDKLPVKTRPFKTSEYIFFVSDKTRLPEKFFYPCTAHA